jgi:hypothetical protein
MRKKTRSGGPQDRRREDVKILAAAIQGAIDRYLELVFDEVNGLSRLLQQAGRWAQRGGALPPAAIRYHALARRANGKSSSCESCGHCDQCQAQRVLAHWSLLGFDKVISPLFDLMLGRGSDLNAALEQLQSACRELTGNSLATDMFMAHAFARAGFAPRDLPLRAAVEAAATRRRGRRMSRRRAPVQRHGLRVIEGGRSRARATTLDM